jgi:hypothetical protein
MSRVVCLYRTASLLALAIPLCAEAPRVVPDGTDRVGTLTGTIRVHVLNFQDWLTSDSKIEPAKLTLFLDGRALKGVTAIPPAVGGDVLRFDLIRTDDNKAVWNALMRRPGFATRSVEISVGPEAGPRIASSATLALEVIRQPWLFWAASALFLALLAGFMWIAHASDVLREPGPQPTGVRPGGKPNRKAYSLSRFQMAFWFFAVIGAFLFIWMITGDRDTLTPTVLTLIGISAATGLGAFVVDDGKRKSAAAELSSMQVESARAAAEALAAPAGPDRAALEIKAAQAAAKVEGLKTSLISNPSSGFLYDVLSDSNGVSFHRFQIFVWTLVLGIIFVVSVYADLAMPEFNATLLGLMGISSGTYLGFKIPEKTA